MLDLTFSRLRPRDLREIVAQPSQRMVLGQPHGFTDDEIARACGGPVAWAVRNRGRLIACFGVAELAEGVHGAGWAVLAMGIGTAHLGLTRFVREKIAACDLPRIEVLALAPDVEGVLARHPGLDTGQIVAIVMTEPTPQIRWAVACGFAPAHVLRCYGGAGESVMLLERLRPELLQRDEREAA